MTKEEAQKLEPFDVVVSNLDHEPNKDLLVKRVTENGVFCLERIQSTSVMIENLDYINSRLNTIRMKMCLIGFQILG